nr:MAG TPA_asm: hypothetical protein [Caudoviricetes sp.]
MSEKLNVRSAAYFDILTVRISGRFLFCMSLERWWRWPTAKAKG